MRKILLLVGAMALAMVIVGGVAWAATIKCEPRPADCRGTRGDDVLRGTPKGDDIAGLPGDDRIYGFAGSDSFDGDPGEDFVGGGFDRDFVDGNSGADTVRGGPGNDDLRGGKGEDTLQGGDGDDYLEATIFVESETGGVDTVTCGEGVDEVIADAGDTVAADCEDVTIE